MESAGRLRKYVQGLTTMSSFTTADRKGDTARGARAIANAQARMWDRATRQRKQEEAKMRQVNDEEDDYRSKAAVHRKEKLSKGLFKLGEGETIIRILKTPKDEERSSPSVWIEYYVHRNVGPKKLTTACGKKVLDDSGPCWLCKVVKLLKEKGKTKLAALLEKQKVYAVQVAVMDEDIGGLRGPLLWPMASGKSAKSLSFKVESIVASKKDYLDHREGYNFTFERQGTGMLDTVYGKTERDEEPSRVPKQIIEKLKPFADVILQYDPENQKQAYYGRVEEDEEKPKRKPVDEDEDEDETPKAKKAAPVDDDDDDEPMPKKRKPPVEEDEDEEEEPAPKKKVKPPVDEDEDEAPTPKKKKPAVEEDEDEEEPAPKKKAKPAADDEDEDLKFPEDEEEESPAPKKKAKPTADEEEDFPEDEDEAPTPKKKKPPVEEDEEEPAPKKKAKPAADDDDESYLNDDEEEEAPKPKAKKKPADDDLDDDLDEAPAPKKRAKPPVEEDEEEEPAPKKKKKPSVEEDEDE